MSHPEKKILCELFHTAVAAAHPRNTLEKHLPQDRSGRAIVIGAGKAAAAMAQAVERAWQGPIEGIVVTRYDHGEPCEYIEVVEASHPVPDSAGQEVAGRIQALAEGLGEHDTVFCLLSGGGSALLSLPAEGISLVDKQTINKALLKSGAPIDEINCVRKHLSAIKGGRLAKSCYPATVITLAISDVPFDDPSVIASGPTVADPSTAEQALEILSRYNIDLPETVEQWLCSPESETPKSEDKELSHSSYTMIATPQDALQAAAKQAREMGLNPIILGDSIEGESRDVAKVHAAIALQIQNHQQPVATPAVILSGGETTVTVRGKGRGGRNAEFLLSLAKTLAGHPGIYAIACDTDGIDGSEDNAGAILSPDTFSRSRELGLDINAMLANNDGYGFFEALGDLLITGPTRTNVNDFRAILVLSAS